MNSLLVLRVQGWAVAPYPCNDAERAHSLFFRRNQMDTDED